MVYKLNCKGTRGFVGDLIHSYFSKRNLFVAIGKKTSHISKMFPLGLLLFSSHINDMTSCCSTPTEAVDLHADDNWVTVYSQQDPKFVTNELLSKNFNCRKSIV